jgi:L-rhamnose mutarotase
MAFKMRLKPGCEEIYKQKHDDIWSEVTALLQRNGVRNYSIYREGLDLFAYLETESDRSPGDPEGAIDPVQRDWWLMMEPYMEYNDDHTPKLWPMEEMFHQD